jgi:hypothetical protein
MVQKQKQNCSFLPKGLVLLSAVLSSMDDVSHNEEKAIKSSEVKAVPARLEHKLLFE